MKVLGGENRRFDEVPLFVSASRFLSVCSDAEAKDVTLEIHWLEIPIEGEVPVVGDPQTPQ